MLGATIVENNGGDAEAPSYDYRDTIVASQKVNWKIEDIIGGDKKLDFSKRFMPESLARVEELGFLSEDEKRVLNQIRAHGYLSTFGLVEETILPFVLDHVRPSLDVDDYRVRAFLQFAGEEAKHIQLFKIFKDEFNRDFGTECKVIGPAAEVAKEILSHDSLGIALAVLMLEWMTQRHYIESIKDDNEIDAQFKSLLKNHWLEEAQHAKLDARMVEELAEGLTPEQIEKGVGGFLAIGEFLDDGSKQQVLFDLEAFETATGRVLNGAEREEFIAKQLQANRWTYMGTGLTHPKFLEMLNRLDPKQRERIEAAAPAFC